MTSTGTSSVPACISVAPGVVVADLEYLGEPRSVAAALLEGTDGIAIVDPGPSTTLPALRDRLAARGATTADVRAVLLTHIHLDHAGVTGTLVRENPGIRVYVHERGAPHVVDPSRLLRSAERIYGDQMDRLWGPMRPVAAEHLRTLGDHDTLDVVGRRVDAAYTPGHAWHHVTYLDRATGVAFIGDTAGERYPGEQYVLPVTPPPDLDVPAWITSLHRVREWQPAALILTHFGVYPDAERHLVEYERQLQDWEVRIQRSLAIDATDDERAAQFVAEIEADLTRQLPPHVVEIYRRSLRSSWDGLARYERKKM
jgi:glyoxylase-like metal-dependent hydrolase (beta-lactamase superfamily II)